MMTYGGECAGSRIHYHSLLHYSIYIEHLERDTEIFI